MKKLFFFILCPVVVFGQIQIGNDIDGELTIGGDHSGRALSLSSDGSVIAIGASRNDGNGPDSGHVRIYKNISGVWTQVGSDIDGEAVGDFSGSSVSLSSDGTIVAIGASSNNGSGNTSGHVRIYRSISGVWTQVGNDIDGESVGDQSGVSVSLSSDGTVVAIGAFFNNENGTSSGHVRIYRNISDVWTQIGSDIDGEAADDFSGGSLSLSSDGNVVAIGAAYNDGNGFNSGHLRIYRNTSDVWTQIGSDIDGETANDNLGTSVSLSSDGSIVAIGAPSNSSAGLNSGYVRIYKNISNVWSQLGNDLDAEVAGDNLGTSVSLSSDGSIVAIGASLNNSNGIASGYVRIYNYVNESWVQIGSDINGEAEGDQSGGALSLSSDGSVIAIGAFLNDGNGFNSGHVRIYRKISDVWTQVGNDIDGGEPVGGNSGNSVSLSSNGNILAVGATANNGGAEISGHVRIFENTSGNWIQIGDDIDGEAQADQFGWNISLSSDGNIIVIGAILNDENGRSSGHTKVFENISGVWTQIGNNINGEAERDLSGYSVDISSDGNIIAIGAVANDGNGGSSGHLRVFENISGNWTKIGDDIDGEAAGDRFGSSVSLSSDGSIVAVGANFNDGNGVSSGHVRVFNNVSGNWTQIGDDIDGEAAGDRFGRSISLSSDGNVVAIGADFNDENAASSGHVRVFENVMGNWIQIGDDIDGETVNDNSGRSISLSSDGSIIAIGAPFNDGNAENSGHVRVYRNVSNVWNQIGTDIDGENELDNSGASVSLSANGEVIAIGAPYNNDNGLSSGHVRVYDLSAVLSTNSFEKDYFTFYPNPVKDILNININKGLELKQVNIYNIQNQYLYSVKTPKIDVSNLSSGFYFIEVVTDEGKSTKKIIIE